MIVSKPGLKAVTMEGREEDIDNGQPATSEITQHNARKAGRVDVSALLNYTQLVYFQFVSFLIIFVTFFNC